MCALTEAHCAGMLVEAEPKGGQLKHTLTWTFFACTYGGIFSLLCLHPSFRFVQTLCSSHGLLNLFLLYILAIIRSFHSPAPNSGHKYDPCSMQKCYPKFRQT